MKLKTSGKIALLLITIGALFGAYRLWNRFGSTLAPEAAKKASVAVTAEDLKPVNAAPGVARTWDQPQNSPANLNKPKVRFLLWAWNAQMGLMAATGGKQTMSGSLMEANGVNLELSRQDDPTKMQENLIAFATALSRGEAQPKDGAHFVAIMGDGGAAFLAGLNENLRRLGPDYTAKVVGSAGYSRGEDKFMGPKAWKQDPSASKGGVVAGYLRDGDWNIAQKWLADNGLKNNPDEKTWDPDALNWVAANDYIDAAEKYITGYKETRAVVRNGKRTGEMKEITVDAVVTWTPGDVNVAQKRGGLVSIVSTREYSAQMPNVIIGIDKWMQNNPETVKGMLRAIMHGGDLIKTKPDAFAFAGEVSAQVYGENDAAYWTKYYRGVTEKDKTGMPVELGGSSVNNLADNLLLFGLVPGSANAFAATYRVFGDIVKQQYPELMPSYDPVEKILDTTYIKALMQESGGSEAVKMSAKPVEPTRPEKEGEVISNRSWNIQFQTGKATFTPQATAVLDKLLRDLVIAGNTTVEIRGHTDNVGDPTKNMALSESRAFAVKSFLRNRAPVNFPDSRVKIMALGQTNPVAPNSTEAGRAQNRRVEIIVRSRSN